MAKMIITTGLPASGKTTWAQAFLDSRVIDGGPKAHSWLRINWDVERLKRGMKTFNAKIEGAMQAETFEDARIWANSGGNLLIDNTNLNQKTVNKWLAIGVQYDMDVQIKNFDTPLEECVRRDELRKEGRVGRAVIERMALFSGLIDLDPTRYYMLVDMDGTLADTTERQKHIIPLPCELCQGTGDQGIDFAFAICQRCDGKGIPKGFKKDWAAWMRECGTEKIREDVKRIVGSLMQSYIIPLIVSGRSIEAGPVTIEWLQKNEIYFKHIFMRNSGDFRDDTIIKQEILDMILAKIPKEQILLAIDDRPKVIRMWQSNGIKVLDVGDQKEF